MKVLVIPEDFRKDQFLLKPLVESLLAEAGRPQAKVRVLTDPLLGGIERALDLEILQGSILPRYRGMVDLFLLIVDRDGRDGRRQALVNLELQARQLLGESKCFLAENAYQEIEVWALGGSDLPKEWSWAEVRPLAKTRNLLDEPGEGRQTLGQEAAKRLARIRTRCPELDQLADRIRSFVVSSTCSGEPFAPQKS